MKNYNSSKNQEIKGKFVSQNVIHSANYLISELQDSDDFKDIILNTFYSFEDWEYMVANAWAELEETEKQEVLEYFEVEDFEHIQESYEEIYDYINDNYAIIGDIEFLEPYEFYIVSDYLGNMLKEKGEIVVDFMGFTIWGRCSSGQAILLDYVISQICDELEILEGQKYEW